MCLSTAALASNKAQKMGGERKENKRDMII
jgi:hypothetical protein